MSSLNFTMSNPYMTMLSLPPVSGTHTADQGAEGPCKLLFLISVSARPPGPGPG